jgi:Arc/MetJ-type ribon-helix-helix transcriptional regulator
MDRITLRVPAEQLEQVERLVDAGEFPTRSEAIRAAIRDLIDDHADSAHRPTADGGQPRADWRWDS